MTLCDLNNMDVTGDGEVSELEFLTYMLVALQKVDRDDIDDIKKAFRKLDGTKTGKINMQDLLAQQTTRCSKSMNK